LRAARGRSTSRRSQPPAASRPAWRLHSAALSRTSFPRSSISPVSPWSPRRCCSSSARRCGCAQRDSPCASWSRARDPSMCWAAASRARSRPLAPPHAATSKRAALDACSTAPSSASLPERRDAAGLLFESHFDHREPRGFGVLEQEARNVLRRGGEAQGAELFAGGSQGRDERIVLVQQELVIELLVDERADAALHGIEVRNHALIVEFLGAQGDERPRVVAVEPRAFARMPE